MRKIFFTLIHFLFISQIIVSQTTVFVGVANNSTDNTAALNNAFQNYSTVIIPTGSNYYKITGTVNIPAGKTLQFNSGGKFNVTGKITGNQTNLVAGEYEIFKNTSIILGTWNTDTIEVKWTGAVGNGTTDDYASLELFFHMIDITVNDQARLGINKNYYIKNEILHDVVKEINLDGRGSRIFRKYADLTSNQEILRFNGVITSEKTLTANLVKGQLTLNVNNTTGLSSKMGVEILSNELYGQEDMGGGKWHYHYKGLMSKIKSINGNKITMMDTIPFDFNLTDVWAVRFFTVIPVTVKNLNLSAENITGTNHINNFSLSQLYDVVLENITCNPLGYLGLSLNSIYNGHFKNIIGIEPVTGGNNYDFGVYGIVPQLNVNCLYENIHVQSVTHGIAFTNEPSYNVVVKNSFFRASWYNSASVDSHASHWVKFENDTIYGAQGNWGTFIFDNCEMHEGYYGDGGGVWNEREGASRGNLEVYVSNCNFYTNTNSVAVSLFYRHESEANPTNKYTILNNTFYLQNTQTYLLNAISVGLATEINPVRVEGNQFLGSGTLWLPKSFASAPTINGGLFTFKNNTYSLVYWSGIPNDQFQTIDILGNTPVDPNTSDFWVNWDARDGNVNFKNNVFVGTCFWIKDCPGNIVFDNNDISNNLLKSSSNYKNRNYLVDNANLIFTNNNLNNTYWTVTGDQLVSGNIYNGVVQPDVPADNWAIINKNGTSVETGQSLNGITNFTFVIRAKTYDETTDAIQYLVGSSVSKLYLGFNPYEPIPLFRGTIRNVNGNIASPSISRFYVDTDWHTYIFTMENGILKGYMDGIAMLSYDASAVYQQMYATGTIQIGGANTANLWKGPINHFAIYNRVLSLTEADYVLENPGATISGEIYRTAINNNNPIAAWNLDETSGTVAYDQGQFSLNGTLTNGPVWSAGIEGNALMLDGTDDWVNSGKVAQLDMGICDFSFSAWVKLSATQNTSSTFISKGGSSTTTPGYWFYLSESKLRLSLSDGISRITSSSNTVNLTDDKWHHIAVTVSRDGNVIFYVDGSNTGESDVSGLAGKLISNTAKSFSIGSNETTSTTFLKGKIDNVKVYQRVISTTEVLSLFDLNPDYTIGHWAFDENSGNTAADSSINNNPGGLMNGPLWKVGLKNNALLLDGINDRVDCGVSANLDMGTGDYTVSAWVKLSPTQSTYPTIVGKGGTSATVPGFWFYIYNNTLRFVFGDGSTRFSCISNSVSLLDDNWHHVAVTLKRNANAVFYFDGLEVGTKDISSFNGKNIANSARPLSIGSSGTSTTSFINGYLDDVKIFSASLSAEDISAMAAYTIADNPDYISYYPFNENSGTTTYDLGTNVYNGTLANGPAWTSGKFGSGISFDGIDDRILCGTGSGLDMGLQDWSIALWTKMPSAQSTYPTFVSKGGSANTNAGYWFYYSGSVLKFVFGDGVSRLSSSSSTVSLLDDSWHFVAVTVDRDGLLTFYLDGISKGTSDVSSYANKVISNSIRDFLIGSSTSSVSYFKGVMDDVQVYNRVLTSAEVMDMASAQQMFALMTGNTEIILEEQPIIAYPNPFHDKLTIAISLLDDQKMDIFIYDVNGKIVKSLDNKMFYKGFNELIWDGRNEAGITLVPGLYFVKIISDSRVDFYRLIKAQ